MSDHVHEWVVGTSIGDVQAWCRDPDCEQSDIGMGAEDINRRLNATERLSGATAKDIANSVEMNSVNYVLKHVYHLHAYAAALEGEDE